MRGVFVDSSVWIDHFRGRGAPHVLALHRLLRALQSPDGADDMPAVLVGDLVLLEVLRGIANDREHAATRQVLLAFAPVTLGGTETALSAADHYRALRRLGITVRKSVDCLIAAWCIAHDVPLLHADRDFDAFARHRGLRCHI